MEVNLQDDPGEEEIKNCLNGVEASRGPKKGKLNKSWKNFFLKNQL